MGARDMTKELPVLEEKIKESIVAELKRQAEERPEALKVSGSVDRLKVDGEIDLDALAMVVIGSMAGGP